MLVAYGPLYPISRKEDPLRIERLDDESLFVVVLLLVSGVIDMVASLPTPIIVGATSYKFDIVIDRRCNSANEVC